MVDKDSMTMGFENGDDVVYSIPPQINTILIIQ